MAQRHKSALKAARQAIKRRQRNRVVLSTVKGAIKKVTAAVEKKDAEAAKASLREAASALSKAASKGVLKPNTVARRISVLAHGINSIA